MTIDMTHEDVSEILPWYANGTLAAGEREAVDTHLAACQACRDELAFLQGVDATATDMAAAMPPVPDSLAATFERIDAFEAARRPAKSSGGLMAWMADLFGPGPARWALAAQLAIIVVLGGLLLSGPPTPDYVTLSGGGSGGSTAGTRLTVMFAPDATEAGIREVLTGAGATVVSGPSAVGVYLVEIPVASEDAAAVDAVIEDLRAAATVVRFVEREP